MAGSSELVELLLEKGAELNLQVRFDGMMPLHMAAQQGYTGSVKLLLDRGVEVNTQDAKTGRTALHWAATSGERSVVATLLGRGADVNIRDIARKTALPFAVASLSIESVALLLDNGADLNEREHGTGRTLLHLVWFAPTARFLLGKGIDINAQDKNGLTALDVAVENRKRKVVTVLKEWSGKQ
ncbi:hypothetical protein MMC10_009879 [Thelotrema lepadinum]|nr:hypothetical protein [Thelotrema lepadinum]